MKDRGFLHNCPPDVVAVVNGTPVTTGDILRNKRARQARILARKRQVWDDVTVPCYIWTFRVPGLIYGGWHLYVHSLRESWWVPGRGGRKSRFILPIMRLYPCGLLPIVENFELWKPAFAAAYPRATPKRPENQGMALARATCGRGTFPALRAVLAW